ncbi:hypothetical protein FHETE_3253 [Fusarium heterosporum]|uniref:Lysine-specific metallo-endopeptidase domain-containing protein n=1 Tax=Fusarium heterosporum TaxID=42747 RepID=A0A8H5TPW3_FUSHE|nr:hypothetical protein FHETE_3253 [Fusarium heterosporum]
MSLFNIFLVGLSILATANATPVTPSSKVTRAAPSSFPLGDACENEWKYLNFDPEDDTDKAHLQKLHDVICGGELRAIAIWGSQAASDTENAINVAYDVFFGTDNDTPAKVNDVLMKIAGQSSTEGKIGEIVGTMIVDSTDFKNQCDTDEAYTGPDTDGREKIHICDETYDKPLAGPDIECGSLDKYPSLKMDTFSRVVLHETLHYSTVGPSSKLESQIVDQQNEDEQTAYGPERAHGLNDSDQDDQPEKAETNADNYAWMALSAWISSLCTPDDEQDAWDSYFPDDPPEY